MKITFLFLNLFIGIMLFLQCKENDNSRNSLLVRDEVRILSNEEYGDLSNSILDLKNRLGCEIAILIVDSTGPKTIEEYSFDYFEKWKFGRKYYNDGLLIIVAINDRKVRIEVGYGLEKIIRDEVAAIIIKEKMIPDFRKGNYFDAIKQGLDSIKSLIIQNQNLIGDQEGINSRWDKIKDKIKK
ncbi:YgcG family protein [Leptospira sp. WS60.C2]